MTRGSRLRSAHFHIAHELPGRLRLNCNMLRDPNLDANYLTALTAAQPGVESVRVNSKAGCIVIRYSGKPIVKERLLALLNTLPPDVFTEEPATMEGPDKAEVAFKLAVAALTPFLPPSLKFLVSWSLAAPTIVKGAETMFTDGLKVEVLDAGVRSFALLRKDYFTSNTIGAMLALAEHMEQAAQRKTNDLLAGLLRPHVETVRVRREGKDLLIPYEEARAGDMVLCGPGEMIPVDGRVAEGEAMVNASSMTGEAAPVHLAPGDDVLSGGVLEEGALVIQAQTVGSDTSTARIAGYIERSLRNTSARQERNERLADKLVPLTFGLGLGIFAVTGSMARAASVLTVDYACAVKLSAPTAVRSAMYAAGREGVLLKGAQALEALANVDTMVFDKTGTLTLGALQVTDVIPLPGATDAVDADTLLSLAAGAEEHYAHPVAAAVTAAAKERGLRTPEMSQVDFVVAHGVSAYVDGQRILVGSRHFIHDDETVDCSAADDLTEELHEQGKSLLYVARNSQLIGVVAMRDRLRPETLHVLEALKTSGISQLIMLTGDQQRTAAALHSQLPALDAVYAECKPEEKARIIERLVAEGRQVAFVGDGVNDAPALIAADVGVCMPSGADLARDVAQTLLLKDDLTGLLRARLLAQRNAEVLQQCLWSSVCLNTALLALAGGGYIPAVVSAALHNGGTLGVLGYAAMRSSAVSSSNNPIIHTA